MTAAKRLTRRAVLPALTSVALLATGAGFVGPAVTRDAALVLRRVAHRGTAVSAPMRFGRGELIRLDRQGLHNLDEELAVALREDLGAVGG